MVNATRPRHWHDLSADEQLALREGCGRFLDSQPPTCDLDTKISRFRAWPAERGIDYSPTA